VIADLLLKIADLAAERRLRGVEPRLSRELQAARYISKAYRSAYKVSPGAASVTYMFRVGSCPGADSSR